MYHAPEAPVLLETTDGIATVTLNRPRAMNALSEDMLSALQEVWDGLKDNRDVKAVILRGAGDHFCAGHNLKEMTARRSDPDGGAGYFNDLFATCSKMMLSIVNLPQPVIAEVQGIATAAGVIATVIRGSITDPGAPWHPARPPRRREAGDHRFSPRRRPDGGGQRAQAGAARCA